MEVVWVLILIALVALICISSLKGKNNDDNYKKSNNAGVSKEELKNWSKNINAKIGESANSVKQRSDPAGINARETKSKEDIMKEKLYKSFLDGVSRFRRECVFAFDGFELPLSAFFVVLSRMDLIHKRAIAQKDMTKYDNILVSSAMKSAGCGNIDLYMKYISYFEKFVAGGQKPRCDFLMFDDSCLEDEDHFTYLLCALGDAIVNPDVVTIGNNAPVVIYGADTVENFANNYINCIFPISKQVVDRVFSIFSIYYVNYDTRIC